MGRRPVYSRRFRTVCSVLLQKTGLLSTFRNSMLCPSSEDRFTLDVSEQYALSVIRRPVYPRHLGTVFSVPCLSSEDQFTLDVSEQYALSVIRRPVYSQRFRTVCSVRLQKTGILSTFRNSMLCPSSEDVLIRTTHSQERLVPHGVTAINVIIVLPSCKPSNLIYFNTGKLQLGCLER